MLEEIKTREITIRTRQLFILPAPKPHMDMRLKVGKVSIKRGELNKRNLCSYWKVRRTTANVQPKVNNLIDRDEQEEALPTSIVVIGVFIRFSNIYIYINVSKDDMHRSINQFKHSIMA